MFGYRFSIKESIKIINESNQVADYSENNLPPDQIHFF